VANQNDMAALIDGLGGADRSLRESAAGELYRRGCEAVQPVLANWLFNAEFERSIVPDNSGAPELTVGLAVHPATFERIRAAHGLPRLAKVPPDQDAMEFELHLPGSVRLDILTTREPGGTGAIARYLEKHGEGIQQIEIGVTDADRATQILRTKFALAPIYPATRPGADGTRVNFFLVPTPQEKKVLVELVETKSEAKP
jgi:hypothetical protein